MQSYTSIGLSGFEYVSHPGFRKFTPTFEASQHVWKPVIFHNLPSMPPMKAAKIQLGMANIHHSMPSLASANTPTPSPRVSVVPQDQISVKDGERRAAQLND